MGAAFGAFTHTMLNEIREEVSCNIDIETREAQKPWSMLRSARYCHT